MTIVQTDILTTTIPSPVGPLTLTSEAGALTRLHMEDQAHAPIHDKRWVKDPGAFDEVAEQLEEYFAGERTTFTLEMRFAGTEFQRRVWGGLRAIPYGETRSYGELAGSIGSPKASRAVGLANGRNPIGIIVPCHRVIAADGTLGGYGGGLERKSILLDLERRTAARQSRT